MNPYIGLALAGVALLVGWYGYGWQGVLTALTVIVFWLLLQFNRVMKVMRGASHLPVGFVESSVMLNAKLHAGMPMLEVLKLTRSLGRKVSDDPETFAWTDPGGSTVTLELTGGRARRWTLTRADTPADAPADTPS